MFSDADLEASSFRSDRHLHWVKQMEGIGDNFYPCLPMLSPFMNSYGYTESPGLATLYAACHQIYPDQLNPLQVVASKKYW